MVHPKLYQYQAQVMVHIQKHNMYAQHIIILEHLNHIHIQHQKRAHMETTQHIIIVQPMDIMEVVQHIHIQYQKHVHMEKIQHIVIALMDIQVHIIQISIKENSIIINRILFFGR